MAEQLNDHNNVPLEELLKGGVSDRFDHGFSDRVLQRLQMPGRSRQGPEISDVLIRIPRAFAWSLTPALVLLAFVAWQNFQLPGGGPLLTGFPVSAFVHGPAVEGELK